MLFGYEKIKWTLSLIKSFSFTSLSKNIIIIRPLNILKKSAMLYEVYDWSKMIACVCIDLQWTKHSGSLPDGSSQ